MGEGRWTVKCKSAQSRHVWALAQTGGIKSQIDIDSLQEGDRNPNTGSATPVSQGMRKKEHFSFKLRFYGCSPVSPRRIPALTFCFVCPLSLERVPGSYDWKGHLCPSGSRVHWALAEKCVGLCSSLAGMIPSTYISVYPICFPFKELLIFHTVRRCCRCCCCCCLDYMLVYDS